MSLAAKLHIVSQELPHVGICRIHPMYLCDDTTHIHKRGAHTEKETECEEKPVSASTYRNESSNRQIVQFVCPASNRQISPDHMAKSFLAVELFDTCLHTRARAYTYCNFLFYFFFFFFFFFELQASASIPPCPENDRIPALLTRRHDPAEGAVDVVVNFILCCCVTDAAI
ncbi:hypothetical protein F5Y16DRAFT_189323 [Xylariaceae sp. FL0255]|nr:hypothetical protein F5Y16DRAFT_189323 [Xylariaceae sp. FL0255]